MQHNQALHSLASMASPNATQPGTSQPSLHGFSTMTISPQTTALDELFLLQHASCQEFVPVIRRITNRHTHPTQGIYLPWMPAGWWPGSGMVCTPQTRRPHIHGGLSHRHHSAKEKHVRWWLGCQHVTRDLLANCFIPAWCGNIYMCEKHALGLLKPQLVLKHEASPESKPRPACLHLENRLASIFVGLAPPRITYTWTSQRFCPKLPSGPTSSNSENMSSRASETGTSK